MTGTYNLLFAGVGGQGVISGSSLLARAAIASGLDVRMYGSYGMAQRGGSVSAQLRIGENVLNARIEKGEVHILMGLELIETVRWVPFVSGGGTVIAHDGLIPPVGKVMRDEGASLREFLAALPNAMLLDAEKVAGPAGSRGVTAVLLGAVSSVRGFPVKGAAIESCIREDLGSKAEPFLAAFRKGRVEIEKGRR